MQTSEARRGFPPYKLVKLGGIKTSGAWCKKEKTCLIEQHIQIEIGETHSFINAQSQANGGVETRKGPLIQDTH